MVCFSGTKLFSLLVTFTLTIHCSAFEGENQIRVSFSIWSPPSMDLDLVDDYVSKALRSFLCQDAKLSLLDSQFRSVCYQQALGGEETVFSNIAKLSMLDFIKQTDPLRSYLVDDASNILVSDSYENQRLSNAIVPGSFEIDTTIQGTTWDVYYEVLQVGSIEMEKAARAGFSDELLFMEHRTQQRLDTSITEGIMKHRLKGTGIIMGRIGQEFGNLPEISLTFEEENIHADPDLDYGQSALILRYIGIAMLISSISSSIVLAYLGRRYRLDKEREELAALDPEYQRGLVTEQGVNLMLEIGRRESERISSSTSK